MTPSVTSSTAAEDNALEITCSSNWLVTCSSTVAAAPRLLLVALVMTVAVDLLETEEEEDGTLGALVFTVVVVARTFS